MLKGLDVNEFEYFLVIIISIVIFILYLLVEYHNIKYPTAGRLKHIMNLGLIINNVYLSYIFLRHLPKYFNKSSNLL